MARLPDFLTIGVMKGGTSALQYHLKKHNSIFVSEPKELHFFIKEWDNGINWYKSFFPDNNDKRICGEATPAYIYFTQYHHRIHETIPDAKLLLALRNPVTRAYSQWNHMREKWYKSMSFEDVIAHDLKNLENIRHVPCYEDLLQRGFYIDQIENLIKFYNINKIHFIISERMKKNLLTELDNVFIFLSVPKQNTSFNKILRLLRIKKTSVNITEGINVREYQEPMRSDTRKMLNALYEPFNTRLYNFLGYEIEEWLL